MILEEHATQGGESTLAHLLLFGQPWIGKAWLVLSYITPCAGRPPPPQNPTPFSPRTISLSSLAEVCGPQTIQVLTS